MDTIETQQAIRTHRQPVFISKGYHFNIIQGATEREKKKMMMITDPDEAKEQLLKWSSDFAKVEITAEALTFGGISIDATAKLNNGYSVASVFLQVRDPEISLVQYRSLCKEFKVGGGCHQNVRKGPDCGRVYRGGPDRRGGIQQQQQRQQGAATTTTRRTDARRSATTTSVQQRKASREQVVGECY